MTLLPFKNLNGWHPKKDKVIAHEFFRWLRNLVESDLIKLALHLLNWTPKWTLPHPKVTTKKINRIAVDCYNAKDWLERNKQRKAVHKYLYFEKHNLGFFDSADNYQVDAWKAFKNRYNVMKAMKNLLLSGPREEFFSLSKKLSSKNKSTRDMSQYAAEFLKVFV